MFVVSWKVNEGLFGVIDYFVRLVPGLSPDVEGHPHLLDLAFLAP